MKAGFESILFSTGESQLTLLRRKGRFQFPPWNRMRRNREFGQVMVMKTSADLKKTASVLRPLSALAREKKMWSPFRLARVLWGAFSHIGTQ
jgi:hypothetical protein